MPKLQDSGVALTEQLIEHEFELAPVGQTSLHAGA